MTETEFLERLSRTRKAYRWQLDDDGQIRGKSRHNGSMFDPITAVAFSNRRGQFNLEAVVDAANSLEISEKLRNNLVAAIDDESTGHGHVQVLRGRVKRALAL